jgi:hypothetical protein
MVESILVAIALMAIGAANWLEVRLAPTQPASCYHATFCQCVIGRTNRQPSERDSGSRRVES